MDITRIKPRVSLHGDTDETVGNVFGVMRIAVTLLIQACK